MITCRLIDAVIAVCDRCTESLALVEDDDAIEAIAEAASVDPVAVVPDVDELVVPYSELRSDEYALTPDTVMILGTALANGAQSKIVRTRSKICHRREKWARYPTRT